MERDATPDIALTIGLGVLYTVKTFSVLDCTVKRLYKLFLYTAALCSGFVFCHQFLRCFFFSADE